MARSKGRIRDSRVGREGTPILWVCQVPGQFSLVDFPSKQQKHVRGGTPWRKPLLLKEKEIHLKFPKDHLGVPQGNALWTNETKV